MYGELDNIIIKKLDTITVSHNNLYRIEIVESFFIHSEIIARDYQHREHDYGSYTELSSNNLCHTTYSAIKLICDRNVLVFPFLLSCFYGRDVFEAIKSDLIEKLIHGDYQNSSLRSNVKRYLESGKNIQEMNDFLYKFYSDNQVIYRNKISEAIESKVKNYVSQLEHEEAQKIYTNISNKVKNFDRNKNRERNYSIMMIAGFTYGFASSLFFIGNIKLNRIFSSGQILAIILIPFLTLAILGKLLDCTRSYNIHDEFRDSICPSKTLSETLHIEQRQYGTLV